MIQKRKLSDKKMIDPAIIASKKNPAEYRREYNAEIAKARKGKKVFIIQAIVFLACCLLIGLAWGSIITFAKSVGTGISKVVSSGTKSLVSSTLGTKPQMDEKGNINIALIGFGGEGHAGSYLTDTMIIASINPEKGTMAMLSVPRDLYVKKPSGYGKINSLFESAFWANKKDYAAAAPALLDKLTEITGVPIQYYAFIDFDGFEKFIDSLGGVDIDVPNPIYDSAYPGPNNSYTVFSISSGLQTLDGATALKYARSRHSTSDYDRSRRQQLIIQGIMNKLLSAKTLLNPSRMEDIYNNITSFIHTDASLQEVLWGLPYADKLKHKSSWQLAVCGAVNWERAQAGCLLYSPPLDAMGGASVQIPSGATPSNPTNYQVTQSYVADIFRNSTFLAEQPTVRVLNGLGTGDENPFKNAKVANNIAIDLIDAGYTIFDIGNATTAPQAQTTILTNGSIKKWTESIERIKRQIPYVVVAEGEEIPDGPSLTLTIGLDFATNNKTATLPTSGENIPLYLRY